MRTALFVFLPALFASACSSPSPSPSGDTGGSDVPVAPIDAGSDALVTPDVLAPPPDMGADNGAPPDDVQTTTDVRDYPTCPSFNEDGMCQYPGGGMGSVNLPPGQPYNPWLPGMSNRNMVPASGTERMRMAETGEEPEYFVPCWNNLFNDDWGTVWLTGPQMGRTGYVNVIARLRNGMYEISVGAGMPLIWSVRNGQGYFWGNFGHMGAPDAFYCRGEMVSECTQLNVSCWSSPMDPLTTPSTPAEETIRVRWGSDHL